MTEPVRHPDFRDRQLCPADRLRSGSHGDEADAGRDRRPQCPSPRLDHDGGAGPRRHVRAPGRDRHATRSISPASGRRRRAAGEPAAPPSSCRRHRFSRLPLSPAAATRWTRLVAEGGLSATAVFQAVLTVAYRPRAAQVSPRQPSDQLLLSRRRQRHRGGAWACRSLAASAILPSSSHAFAGTLRGRSQAEAADAVPLPEHRGVAPPARPKVRACRAGVARRGRGRGRLCPVRLRAADPGAGDRHLGCERRDADARHGARPGLVGPRAGALWACPVAMPIALKGGRIDLDLPEGIDREAAIAWNVRYEAENGLVVGPDGRARYTGRSA